MEWPADAGDVRLRVLHFRRFPFEGVGAAGTQRAISRAEGHLHGEQAGFRALPSQVVKDSSRSPISAQKVAERPPLLGQTGCGKTGPPTFPIELSREVSGSTGCGLDLGRVVCFGFCRPVGEAIVLRPDVAIKLGDLHPEENTSWPGLWGGGVIPHQPSIRSKHRSLRHKQLRLFRAP